MSVATLAMRHGLDAEQERQARGDSERMPAP
jgi:hypothetical protein